MIIRELKERFDVLIESDRILEEMVYTVLKAEVDVFNLKEHYTKVFQKYSTVDRDVNLSVGVNENSTNPKVSLFVGDKFRKLKIDYVYTKDGDRIIEQNTNIKSKDEKAMREFTIEVPTYSEETKNMTNIEFYEYIKTNISHVLNQEVKEIKEEGYDDKNRIFKAYL